MRRPWLRWGLLVGVALALRLVAAQQHISEGPWMPDEHDYIDIARSLVEHGEFRTDSHASTEIIRGPTYSAFLTPFVRFSSNSTATKEALIVQALFGVAVLLLMTAALARLLASDERTRAIAEPAAWLAACLMAISPMALLYDRVLLSESLTTLLLAAALTAWIYDATSADRRRVSPLTLACGLILGTLILAKPAVIFLPLGLAGAQWWAARRRGDRQAQTVALSRGAVVLMVSALVVLPWTFRNYRLTHKLIPVGIGAGTFLYQATLPSNSSGVPLIDEQDKPLMDVYMSHATPVEERIAVDRAFGARARARIATHPGPYLKNIVLRPAHLWISSHSSMAQHGFPRLVGAAIMLFSLVMLAAALLLPFVVPAESRLTFMPLAVVPLYFTLVHLPIAAGGRYTVPAWPAVLCLAAATIAAWMRKRRASA
jgi:4-amino-4-deoxy-L-arabinose transferase-like glycosyltransferase